MLVGAVMGFWAVQRTGSPAFSRGRGRRGRRRGDGADPRFPRRHLAREPDRLGARADDLRGCGRALVVPGQRPKPRRRAGASTSSPRSCRRLAEAEVIGPILLDQTALVYASWVFVVVVGPLPRPHRPGPERARGRRVAGRGRRDGDQRRRVPVRPHARRRRIRRRRGGVLLARDHPAMGRRHDVRARLDRGRAGWSSPSGG